MRGVGPNGHAPKDGGRLTSETAGWGAVVGPGGAEDPENRSEENTLFMLSCTATMNRNTFSLCVDQKFGHYHLNRNKSS